MSVDLNLPTFGLDCREWLVATEADGLVLDEADGTPVVAVLSTAVVVGAQLRSAQAVLSLALLHDDAVDGNLDRRGDTHDIDTHDIDTHDIDTHDIDTHDIDADRADAGQPPASVTPDPATWADQDICVLDADWAGGYARFAVPVPGGELAVVAEFRSAPAPSRILIDRFYDLVTSFRWAA